MYNLKMILLTFIMISLLVSICKRSSFYMKALSNHVLLFINRQFMLAAFRFITFIASSHCAVESYSMQLILQAFAPSYSGDMWLSWIVLICKYLTLNLVLVSLPLKSQAKDKEKCLAFKHFQTSCFFAQTSPEVPFAKLFQLDVYLMF